VTAGAPGPALSVVVPAWREERRLPTSLAGLPAALESAGVGTFEVLVVDDGSDDGTSDVVEAAAARDPRVRLLRLERHRGKGGAVRAGVLAARAPWVLVSDADLSTPPQDVRALLAVGAAGVPVVIGSRRVPGARILVRQPLHREVLGFLFAASRRLLVLPTLRDTQCGFKLFRADTARALFGQAREDGWIYDVEILALARWNGVRVAEVPVRWADDPRTQVVAAPASVAMALGLLRLAVRRLRHALRA
jgi:dolichyl-phosphate beta-glucosyltransferase